MHLIIIFILDTYNNDYFYAIITRKKHVSNIV